MGSCCRQMSINPIFTENSLHCKQHSAFIKHAHRLEVQAVYDWKKPIKEEIFDEMRIFCKENHILHEFREFLPEPLEEDREFIVRLPAFQIYLDGEYEKTAYLDDFIAVIKGIVMDLDKKPPEPPEPPKSVGWTFPKFTFMFRRKNRIASHTVT